MENRFYGNHRDDHIENRALHHHPEGVQDLPGISEGAKCPDPASYLRSGYIGPGESQLECLRRTGLGEWRKDPPIETIDLAGRSGLRPGSEEQELLVAIGWLIPGCPVSVEAQRPRAIAAFVLTTRHYFPGLPKLSSLLLKDSSQLRRIRYALFKR